MFMAGSLLHKKEGVWISIKLYIGTYTHTLKKCELKASKVFHPGRNRAERTGVEMILCPCTWLYKFNFEITWKLYIIKNTKVNWKNNPSYFLMIRSWRSNGFSTYSHIVNNFKSEQKAWRNCLQALEKGQHMTVILEYERTHDMRFTFTPAFYQEQFPEYTTGSRT